MGQITPYQPMGQPQRCSSTEDMWEKLAKNSKPDVQVSTETQSPKAKASLQWNPPVWTSGRGPEGPGYLLTVCGRYSISKDGHELGYSYSPWKRDKQPATNLGCCRTSDEAKRICEAEELKTEALR